MIMALSSSHTIETRRAALHYLTAVCNKADLPRPLLLEVLETLLQCLLTPPSQMQETMKSEGPNSDVMLQAKVILMNCYIVCM